MSLPWASKYLQANMLITRKQAQTILAEQELAVPPEQQVALAQADNRVLARDLTSKIHSPPFSASAMDGYAYRWRPGPQRLAVPLRIAAGDAAPALEPQNACARIFTGAMLPNGTDSVIAQEDCQLNADGSVSFMAQAQAGKHVRLMGSEFMPGDQLVAAGTRLRPEQLALAAACGWQQLPVYAPAKLALIASGDELVMPGAPLRPGQIYNSNAVMLASWLQRRGFAVEHMPVLGDSLDATRQMLQHCAGNYQAVVISGGVSVGEEDHVRTALEQLGEVLVAGVAIKPGKPFTCARIGDSYLFGLPGNPASALVTLEILASELLLKLAGQRHELRSSQFQVTSAVDIGAEKRERYLRANLDSNNRAQPHPRQLSSSIAGLSQSQGYLIIPAQTAVQAGDTLAFMPYR